MNLAQFVALLRRRAKREAQLDAQGQFVIRYGNAMRLSAVMGAITALAFACMGHLAVLTEGASPFYYCISAFFLCVGTYLVLSVFGLKVVFDETRIKFTQIFRSTEFLWSEIVAYECHSEHTTHEILLRNGKAIILTEWIDGLAPLVMRLRALNLPIIPSAS